MCICDRFLLSGSLATWAITLHLTSVDLVCAVFPCVQTMVWLTMSGIFNVCTVSDCIWWLYERHKKVCMESWLGRNNPLPHQLVGPASAAFWNHGSATWATPPPHLTVLNAQRERQLEKGITQDKCWIFVWLLKQWQPSDLKWDALPASFPTESETWSFDLIFKEERQT